MAQQSSDERQSVESPTARQFAQMSEFVTDLANLTRKANVLISTTFQLGHRCDGDFTAIKFEYDHSEDTYRAVPVTYTRTLGGAR